MTNTSNASPDTQQALDLARWMATQGIPIFCAYPAMGEGVWDPRGGTGGTGYVLPKGWQATTADPRYVDAWRSGMALCMVTGHGLDLIDIDPRNGGSADALNGALPLAVGSATTPSGGTHLFVNSLGVRSMDGVMAGIDVKAGVPEDSGFAGCGFAFLAPTARLSKVTGSVVTYAWVESSPELLGVADTSGEKLAALISDKRGPAGGLSSGPGPAAVRYFTRSEASAFVQPALEALRAAQVGTVNACLNVAAVTVGHFVGDFGTYEDASAELLSALAATAYDGQTWQASATISSGISAGLASWRAVLISGDPLFTDEAMSSFRSASSSSSGDGSMSDALLFTEIDWHELWADETQEEWIVEPLLSAGRLVAMYSAPKVGKSLLMLEVAAGIACGKPVLGALPARPYSVLYVDLENDPRADVRERLKAMGYGPGELSWLHYLSFPSLAALDSPQGGAELMLAVEQFSAEVVVIDTVSRTVAGEENANDTWLAFYRNTGLRLKRAGVALVRLDHSGKDETKGQRGGSAKLGDVDVVWRLSTVVDDKTFRLDCEANRMPIAERTLTLHRKTSPLRHQVDAHGRLGAWDAKVAEVVDVLDGSSLPFDAGRRTAREAVRDAGVTASDAVLNKAIEIRKKRLGIVDEEV